MDEKIIAKLKEELKNDIPKVIRDTTKRDEKYFNLGFNKGISRAMHILARIDNDE